MDFDQPPTFDSHDGDATIAQQSPPSPLSTAIAPAPAAPAPKDDASLHRCFICLTDEPDGALPRDWATPCTCALEGHQSCMLDWITDLEAQGKGEDEFACPLCKSRIRVVDGDDDGGTDGEAPGWARWLSSAPVAMARRLGRAASDWSPTVLLAFLGAGTFVGGAAYGFEAVELFAGPEIAARFLFKEKPSSPFPAALQRRLPFLSLEDGGWLALRGLSSVNIGALCVLPYVGPAIILNRLLFIPQLITVPVSMMVSSLPPCPSLRHIGVLFTNLDANFSYRDSS